jgi:succinate dehydrogenase / fumarate reductase iron-sulfur subunit
MHPLDTEDRVDELKQAFGVGLCNITKCCTVVCPEHIKITDNAIIPLKERVVDRFYDPVARLLRMFRRDEGRSSHARAEAPVGRGDPRSTGKG